MLSLKNFSIKVLFASNFFISCFLFVLFIFLSISSLVFTSIIDPDFFVGEHILYIKDNIFLNIVFLILLILFLKGGYVLLKKLPLNYSIAVLIAYTAILGVIWVASVKSVPAADSGSIFRAAAAFSRGDYSSLAASSSYYNYYPFQLGYTLFCQFIMSITGSDSPVLFGIINVFFLCLSYFALINLTSLIFEDIKITYYLILLLALCFQPIFFCSFVYGNIAGFSLSICALWFTALYLKNKNTNNLMTIVVFSSLASVAKPNSYIVLTAIAIILILDFINKFDYKKLIAIFAIFFFSIALNQLIIAGYQSKAGTDIPDGMPQIAWISMSFQDSSRASGWYNSKYMEKLKSAYSKNNNNPDAVKMLASEDLKARAAYFSENPEQAVKFITRKIVSQWNEPSYQSLWVSQVKKHSSPVPAYIENIYTGTFGLILNSFFNIFQLLVFICFSISMLLNLKNLMKNGLNNISSQSLIVLLVPLCILGGFLFHLISEAKAQYIMIYFVMLLPYAAQGLIYIIEADYSHLLEMILINNSQAKE